MLIRGLYVSKPIEGVSAEALEDLVDGIAAKCLAYNARHEITGALVYSQRYFAQAVEGPAAEIYELLTKIALDPSHVDFKLLDVTSIRGRAFPDWSMAVAHKTLDRPVDRMPTREILRLLISAAQNCDGIRCIPGYGPAPESAFALAS